MMSFILTFPGELVQASMPSSERYQPAWDNAAPDTSAMVSCSGSGTAGV